MNKIQALEKTIYNLENDVYVYDWSDTNHCNCGVLARTLLNGKFPRDAGFGKGPDNSYPGTFSGRAVCITTGIDLPEVFGALKEAGFTYRELGELEFLGNIPIAEKAGLRAFHYKDDWNAAHSQFQVKKNVIKYLKAWVEILKQQEVKEPEPIQQPERTRIVYVSVPETIKEQAEQLITN